MIAVLRAELYKMLKLKKVYAALLTVALPPLFLLLTLGVIYVKELFYGSGLLLKFVSGASTTKALLGLFFFGLKAFSWIAWIYLMILVGETVAKEFSTGTMKTLLVQPVKRLSVYGGKFLSILLAYAALLALYLGLFLLAVLFLRTGFYADLAPFFPLDTAGKIFGAWLVIDLTWLALAVLVACLATTVETTIYYNILVVMTLSLLDVTLNALRKAGALDDWLTRLILERGFIRTTGVLDLDTMHDYVTRPDAPFPARFDQLFANALWGILFLALGALVFLRRETRS